MFYKIVSNGRIIDVCIDLSFVRWQKRIETFLCCSNAADADGIISSDGSTIYLLDSAKQVVNGLDVVTYSEIDEETYTALLAELVENGVLDDPQKGDSGTEDGSDAEVREPVANSKDRQLIEILQAQVDMLTECVLELSEAVYG